MKTCKDCLQLLPESEFYASPNTADGLYGNCKKCFIAHRMKRYDETREMEAVKGSAIYIARHQAKRIHEMMIAESLVAEEPPRPYVQPLSYAGLIDHLFRSPKRDPRRRVSA